MPWRWEERHFPGKQPTLYTYGRVDGIDSVQATAVSSASMFRTVLQLPPAEVGHLQFSWKVPALIAASDMGRRDADDAPARLVLAFDGDRSRFSTKDALLSELARTLTGEEMPYATLTYVWCNHRPVGTVIPHPRTDRIRALVVESGPMRLGQWVAYERDVQADFKLAFGEPAGGLLGVALMTDSDNTRSDTHAWYGPVRLLPQQ
ncbi:DUF3047 domain-containing protein [Xylophilus sp. GW821-FHT01B05]